MKKAFQNSCKLIKTLSFKQTRRKLFETLEVREGSQEEKKMCWNFHPIIRSFKLCLKFCYPSETLHSLFPSPALFSIFFNWYLKVINPNELETVVETWEDEESWPKLCLETSLLSCCLNCSKKLFINCLKNSTGRKAKRTKKRQRESKNHFHPIC